MVSGKPHRTLTDEWNLFLFGSDQPQDAARLGDRVLKKIFEAKPGEARTLPGAE
jgi:hypothetical protein